MIQKIYTLLDSSGNCPQEIATFASGELLYEYLFTISDYKCGCFERLNKWWDDRTIEQLTIKDLVQFPCFAVKMKEDDTTHLFSVIERDLIYKL